MPLFTSAREYTRTATARVTGFNGYAASSESYDVVEASGLLLETESVPNFGSSFATVPFPERMSCSARKGDRVSFSVSVIGATAGGFSVDTTNNLGTLLIECDGNFSWNLALSFEGPACGGKFRVTGISGSGTVSGGAVGLPYCPFTVETVTSESGTEYSDTDGAQSFTTVEIVSASGIPWSDWQIAGA